MDPPQNSNVQLLQVLADYDCQEEDYYRFLIDGKDVKYVTVDPGILPRDDRTFAPVLIPALPPFPPGDWNEGVVTKCPDCGDPIFSHYAHNDLPEVSNIWHDRRIDHLEFTKIDQLRQNVYVATHPLFEHPVLVKFAEFPWQIPYFEAETAAYEWVQGQGVAPEFLGHLTEADRVFGFITEYMGDARTAEAGDLAVCQDALSRLHSLGIKHGDIVKYNFLVRGGEAFVFDLESAKRDVEKEELDAESTNLLQSLNDTSRRGGGYFEEEEE